MAPTDKNSEEQMHPTPTPSPILSVLQCLTRSLYNTVLECGGGETLTQIHTQGHSNLKAGLNVSLAYKFTVIVTDSQRD